MYKLSKILLFRQDGVSLNTIENKKDCYIARIFSLTAHALTGYFSHDI